MELLHLHDRVIDKSVRQYQIVLILFILSFSRSFGYIADHRNSMKSLQDFEPDIEPYDDNNKIEKHIFDYRKNGMRLNVKIVPKVNNSIVDKDDRFPMIPIRDLGRCVINFSLTCAKERIAGYIDTIGQLNQITLFGNALKFVKVRAPPREYFNSRSINTDNKIDQSIENFFNQFALRITLPRSNTRKEDNQIDFMFDDDQVQGRGGKGGGGGGKGGKGCKQMMMCMMMAVKMKMIAMMGLMMMKGLAMGGFSMMMTKAMLVMTMMKKGGGGPWAGGGGGHGGGAPLKEIVLLTKATGSTGGGGGGYAPPPPPPPPPPPSSSYGVPSTGHGGGGGGGYDYSGGGGGGGGWGRSFDNRLSMTQNHNDEYSTDEKNPQQIANNGNLSIVNTSPVDDYHHSLSDNNDNWQKNDYMFNNQDEHSDSEHIGEVYEINESNTTESELTKNNGKQFYIQVNNVERESNSRKNFHYNHPKNVYADYWKNYEAADKIWDTKGPIVATRVY